jgi:putative DNA primase/helicase
MRMLACWLPSRSPAAVRLVADAARAVKNAGLHFPEVVPDGRFHLAPKPHNSQWLIANGGTTRTGKAWLSLSGGDFRETCGEYRATFAWQSWSRGDLTASELAEIRTQARTAKKATDLAVSEKQEAARHEGMSWWRKAVPARHQYLDAKRLPRGNTRRYGKWLLVPMYDVDGPMLEIQGISPSGDKRFLPGMRTRGAYHPITPSHLNGHWLLAEGWATAYALALVRDAKVAVCFSGGNLLHVAKAMRRDNPAIQLTICGDNDHRTERERGYNPGRQAAERAANEVGCEWLVPDFSSFQTPDWASDFYDLAALEDAL